MATNNKNLFVISPIGKEGETVRERANRVYTEIISPAAKECGYEPIRMDFESHPGDIPSQIMKHLLSDSMAVADLTGHNANVFYELGVRHACGKPVIHIISAAETLPFDVYGTNTIFFELTDTGMEACREKLIRYMRSANKGDDAPDTPLSLTVSKYMFQEVQAHMEEIRNSVSTRYSGEMEVYYGRVIDLIKSAEKSIDILCDYPAYGCFTQSEYWNEYRRALKDKRMERRAPYISLTCPDKPHRRVNDTDNYFPKAAKKWAEWKRNPKNQRQLRQFLQYMGLKNQNINALTRKAFFDLLLEADEKMFKECFDKKKEVDDIPPLDFWVIDGKRAIFAFSNYARGSSRYGFYTEDQNLISAFGEIEESYHRKHS